MPTRRGPATATAVLTLVLILAACAAQPEDYAGQPGAGQALSKCRQQAMMLPSNTNAQANPMFAAAMQEQYVTDCMKAAGYRN